MSIQTKHRVQVKTVDRGCLTGYGPTVAGAKADLDAKVDRAVAGGSTLAAVSWGDYTAFVMRDPQGWFYFLWDSERLRSIRAPGVHPVHGGSSGYYDERKACLDLAASHVLDVGSGPEDFHRDSDIPEWLEDPARRSILLGNARFRRAALWARDNAPDGIDPGDSGQIHRWACDHSRDPEFA